MENFVTVVTLLVPLLTLVLVGYLSRRLEYFPASAVKGLAAFITRVAVPVALFLMIAGQDLGKILDIWLITGYLLATAGIALVTFCLARFASDALPVRAMAMAFGTSTSNAVMIGFPIVPIAFGGSGSAAVTILFLVQSCILIPLTLAIWGGFHSQQRPTLRTAFGFIWDAIKNPLISGILFGMVVAFVRYQLPDEVEGILARVMQSGPFAPISSGISVAAGALAQTALGLALFYIGCNLHGSKFLPLDRQVGMTAGLKLLGHPLLMFVSMSGLSLIAGKGFNWEIARACIALAAIPMISVYPAMASQFGEEVFASRASTFTLILGAVSLTGWLILTLP